MLILIRQSSIKLFAFSSCGIKLMEGCIHYKISECIVFLFVGAFSYPLEDMNHGFLLIYVSDSDLYAIN